MMQKEENEVKLLVFDLNGTFYKKHSKDEFFKFILSKEPHRFHYYLQMSYYKMLKKVNQIRQTEFKENFFNYLDHLKPDQVTEYAQEFWQREFPQNFNLKLKDRFDEMRAQGILIFCATGGLELYVKPLFDLYPIDGFTGTQVRYDGTTYKVIGKACKEEEKVARINQYFPGKQVRIIEAYSDSKEVILDKADKSFLIKDEKIVPYSKEEPAYA